MQSFKYLLVAFVLIIITTSTQAAERGWYIGGGLGEYRIKVDDTNFDEDAKILRFLAGYQINRYLAVEADYLRLLETDDDRFVVDNKVDADLYGVAVRPILPLSEHIDLYGRAGYSKFKLNERVRFFGVGVTDEELKSDEAFVWGAGISGHFGKLTVRGEFSQVELDGSNLELLTLNLLFRF